MKSPSERSYEFTSKQPSPWVGFSRCKGPGELKQNQDDEDNDRLDEGKQPSPVVEGEYEHVEGDDGVGPLALGPFTNDVSSEGEGGGVTQY